MKKTLIYISIFVTIMLLGILIPHVFAAGEGDIKNVRATAAVEDANAGCEWTGTPGQQTSDLQVPDGEICTLSGADVRASDLTIASGGTLIVGSITETTNFTVYDSFNIEGTVQIGQGTSHGYSTYLSTNTADLTIQNGGSLTSTSNTTSGANNALKVDGSLIVGTVSDETGTLTLNDNVSVTYNTAEHLTVYGTVTFNTAYTITGGSPLGTTSVFNDGSLTTNGVFHTTDLKLGNSGGTPVSGGTITNTSEFYVDTLSAEIEIYRGSFINNNPGTFALDSSDNLILTGGVTGGVAEPAEFENNSTANPAVFFKNLTINSNATFDHNAGTIIPSFANVGNIYVLNTTTGTGTVPGILDIASGAIITDLSTLFVGDATHDGGTVNNAGTITNRDSYIVNVYLYSNATFNNNAGTITRGGAVQMYPGAYTGAVFNNNSNGIISTTHLYTNHGIFNNYASETNKGITVSDNFSVEQGGTFNNQGNLTAKAFMIGYSYDDSNGGVFNSSGSGNITLSGTGRFWEIYKGTLDIQNTLTLAIGGTISGDGTEQGSLVVGNSSTLTISGSTPLTIDAYGKLLMNSGSLSVYYLDVAQNGEIEIVTGTVAGTQTTNSGLIYMQNGTYTSTNTTVNAYGSVLMDNGIFNATTHLYINSDGTNDGVFNLATDATLKTPIISLGNGSGGQGGNIINAGFISRNGTRSSAPTTNMDIFAYNGAEITNNSGGIINNRNGGNYIYASSTLTNNTGAAIINGPLWVEGTDARVYSDGQLDTSGYLKMLYGGQVSFTGTYTYPVSTIEMQSTDFSMMVSKDSRFTIGSNATVQVNNADNNCKTTSGYYCSIEIGTDTVTGTPALSEIIVNGTLTVPVNNTYNANIEVGGPGLGKITVGSAGHLTVSETPGTGAKFYVRGNGTLQGNLTVNHAADLAMPMEVSGDMIVGTSDETPVDINIAEAYTVTSTGTVNQRYASSVSVIGSTTTISGDYELDGLLDTGMDDGDSLTITSTGNVYSGVGTATSFFIKAHDFTIEEGGKIASDAVSEYMYLTDGGAGSYGGEGWYYDRSGTHGYTYGKAKMTADDSPLYGEAGNYGGSTVAANGGGGVKIYSTGSIVMDGTISANGATSTLDDAGTGAGGTIIIEQDPLSKNDVFTGISGAKIQANGGDNGASDVPCGGGGRISIQSILLDDPADARVGGEYGFKGTIEARGGIDLYTDAAHGAPGTIVYLGDGHNANGTLIVDAQDYIPSRADIYDDTLTEIPNSGDLIFDRVEARNGAVLTYAADPVTEPVSCFQVNGGYVNETYYTCTPYPDKPDSLYINNPFSGAQTEAEPSRDNSISNIFILTPVFSVVYRNPEDTTTPVRYLDIQIDDNSNFGTPIWDTTIDLGAANTVVNGERTRDILFDEDDTATGPLATSTTYYVRMAFRDSTNTVTGLWTHRDIGDANGDYHYNFDVDGSMIIDENCFGMSPGNLFIKDASGGGNLRDVNGDKYGNGECDISVTSTTDQWQILFGKKTIGATFSDGGTNNIDPIDNTGGGTACEMATAGTGTVEEYGYNLDTTLSSTDLTNNILSDAVCSRNYDNSDQGAGNEYMFDVPENGSENIVASSTTPGDTLTDDSFSLVVHASVNSGTAVTSYSLDVHAIITTNP